MTFELSFNFPDEKVKGFDLINAALSNMELSNLRIAEQKGSLAVVQFADASKPKQYGYQLSKIALKCNQNAETGNHRFQFDSAAFPWEECGEDEDYMETWKKNHPDRELCFLQTVTYDAAKATVFNVLHREKRWKTDAVISGSANKGKLLPVQNCSSLCSHSVQKGQPVKWRKIAP